MAELFLDRIEGDVAVLVYGERQLNVPRALLPADAREGDVLRLTRDPAATERAKREQGQLRQKLGGSDDGGDIKL